MDYILTVALYYLLNVVLCNFKSGSQTFKLYRPMKRNAKYNQKTLGTMTNGLPLKFYFCQVRIF